ncbi:CotH kinase family protein [Sphingobacterium multivorum]|uniref:CotH kinase family protein n=1 Tax=Sphingobacterium multivorum TaxID=28454 RepID=UPI003DA3718A
MQNYQVNVNAGTKLVAEIAKRIENSLIGASVEAEPLVGGSTEAEAVNIPNGPEDADRKWELAAGKWYKINNVAQQIADGKRWVAWWDHVDASVTLKEMATYAKPRDGQNGQGLLPLWDSSKPGGYMKDAQVRDVDGVTYVSLKDGNSSELSVSEDWKSTGQNKNWIVGDANKNTPISLTKKDGFIDLSEAKVGITTVNDLKSSGSVETTQAIDVNGFNSVVISARLGRVNGLVGYDVNGKFLNTLLSSNSQDSKVFYNKSVKIPAGVKFVSLSGFKDTEIEVSLSESVESDPSFFFEKIEELNDKWLVDSDTYKSIFSDITKNQEKKLSLDGLTISNDIAWQFSGKNYVNEFTTVKYKLRGDTGQGAIFLYPADGTPVKVLVKFEGEQGGNAPATNIEGEIVVTEKGDIVFQNRPYQYTQNDLYFFVSTSGNGRNYYDAQQLYDDIQEAKKMGGNADKTSFRELYIDRLAFFEIRIKGNLPTKVEEPRDTTKVEAVFISKNRVFLNCNAKLTIQGNGSSSYDDKGYTFDLLNSEDKSLSVKFGNMISVDSFHLKAYATDRTHTRDVGSGRLWRDMINQLDYPLSNVHNKVYSSKKNAKSPNIDILDAQFFTDGIPCAVYVNDNFNGLYTLRLKKTRENYAIDRDNLSHIFLDSATLTAFLKEKFDSSDWEVKSPRMNGYQDTGPIPNATVLANINRLFDFTRTLDTSYNNHADFIVLPHWILWYIHAELIGNVDTDGNNYNLFTWNAAQWSIVPYDMDLTIGLNAWAGYVIEESKSGYLINHDIWSTFRTKYNNEIKSIYKKMRDSGFLTVTKILSYYVKQGESIPRTVYESDRKKWASIWNNDEPNIEQIGVWISSRITYLDSVWL